MAGEWRSALGRRRRRRRRPARTSTSPAVALLETKDRSDAAKMTLEGITTSALRKKTVTRGATVSLDQKEIVRTGRDRRNGSAGAPATNTSLMLMSVFATGR